MCVGLICALARGASVGKPDESVLDEQMLSLGQDAQLSVSNPDDEVRDSPDSL